MYQPAVLLSLIPNMSETKMADWSATNQLVMSWLLNAIEPTIATSLMFMASAKQVWSFFNLHDLYSIGNEAKIFQLE